MKLALEAMNAKNEGAALDYMKRVDELNDRAEKIVNSARKKLPKEYSDVKVWENFTYPIRHLSKEDELDEAKKLGFDDLLYYTWTCWFPINGKPCNKCKPCKERIIECRSIGDTI